MGVVGSLTDPDAGTFFYFTMSVCVCVPVCWSGGVRAHWCVLRAIGRRADIREVATDQLSAVGVPIPSIEEMKLSAIGSL
jgi:hypothetical protein